MKVITERSALEESCRRLGQFDFLTVDTEFLRETTFWPQLCLIQIASEEEEFIIDPMAKGLDLDPFFQLMADQNIVKVFHAARQDVEIIHHLSSIVPVPLFDTQVAAMVCGFGDSVSYSQLAKKVLNVDLDKTSRFTDWSRRPLTDKQLHYALGDVTHLRGIYKYLKTRLESTNRAPWLDEEMAVLIDPATYELHPEDAWKRLKMRIKSKEALSVMMELAMWREIQAQSQDVPRARVIKDDAIYDIANQMPRAVHDLSRLRTVSDSLAKSAKGKDILSAVERGLARDLDQLPPIKKTKPLPPTTAAISELLRVLLKAVAARHGVAPKLIATSDDIEKIAVSDQAKVPALSGWRFDMFGRSALALKHGELALTIDNGEITVIEKEETPDHAPDDLIDLDQANSG